MRDIIKNYKKTLGLAVRYEINQEIAAAGELNDKIYEISYEEYRIAYDTFEILKNSSDPEIKEGVSKLKQIIDKFEKTNGKFICKQIKGEIPSLNQKPL